MSPDLRQFVDLSFTHLESEGACLAEVILLQVSSEAHLVFYLFLTMIALSLRVLTGALKLRLLFLMSMIHFLSFSRERLLECLLLEVEIVSNCTRKESGKDKRDCCRSQRMRIEPLAPGLRRRLINELSDLRPNDLVHDHVFAGVICCHVVTSYWGVDCRSDI